VVWDEVRLLARANIRAGLMVADPRCL
jgi:hypothetical protein